MSNVIIKRDISPIYLSPESQWRFFGTFFNSYHHPGDWGGEKYTQPEHSPLNYLCKQIKRLAEHDHFQTESKYRAVSEPPTWCINQSRLLLQDGFYINLSINSRGLHAHYLLASIEGWRMSVPNLANWPNDVLKHPEPAVLHFNSSLFFLKLHPTL